MIDDEVLEFFFTFFLCFLASVAFLLLLFQGDDGFCSAVLFFPVLPVYSAFMLTNQAGGFFLLRSMLLGLVLVVAIYYVFKAPDVAVSSPTANENPEEQASSNATTTKHRKSGASRDASCTWCLLFRIFCGCCLCVLLLILIGAVYLYFKLEVWKPFDPSKIRWRLSK
jgi:uncharacterized MnhB-related membrane protein